MNRKEGKKGATDPLVGKFFHSVEADRKTIHWQGQVKARVGDSYLVQLYEYLVGQESEQVLVPLSDMSYWKFYDSAEEMRENFENYRRELEGHD